MSTDRLNSDVALAFSRLLFTALKELLGTYQPLHRSKPAIKGSNQ